MRHLRVRAAGAAPGRGDGAARRPRRRRSDRQRRRRRRGRRPPGRAHSGRQRDNRAYMRDGHRGRGAICNIYRAGASQ